MRSSASDLGLNTLLAALPHDIGDRMRCFLTPVYLPHGKVLYEPGVKLDEVYFPTTAIISLQCELADGTCAEMAVVGHEAILASHYSWVAKRPRGALSWTLQGMLTDSRR